MIGREPIKSLAGGAGVITSYLIIPLEYELMPVCDMKQHYTSCCCPHITALLVSSAGEGSNTAHCTRDASWAQLSRHTITARGPRGVLLSCADNQLSQITNNSFASDVNHTLGYIVLVLVLSFVRT